MAWLTFPARQFMRAWLPMRKVTGWTTMSAVTIGKLEPRIKDKLRLTAAGHGRSMGEEVCNILRSAVTQPNDANGLVDIGNRMHARFVALGGVNLPSPERTDLPRGASFDESICVSKA